MKKGKWVINEAFVAVNASKAGIFLVGQQQPYSLTCFLDIVYYSTMSRKFF